MADPEVATKAPECDAAEQSASVPSSDGPSQMRSSMGSHCTTDRPTSTESAPSGEVTKIGDVDVYISKPSDYPHLPSKLLLLLSSGTGLHSKNNQLQADKFASEGFLVIMPDLFEGDPAPNSTTTIEEVDLTIIERIKLGAAEVAKSFLIDLWLARHSPEKVFPIIFKVLEGTRDEYADAITSGGGIYCVGYCFGARYCLLLAGERPDAVPWGQKPADEEAGLRKSELLIKAGAVAHGTQVTVEEFRGLRAPMMLICVENDQLFPYEVLKEGEEYMKEHNVEYDVKIYPGVPHGFAIIGDYEDKHIRVAQEQAFTQMLNWLNMH